jgi:hypothetical protein
MIVNLLILISQGANVVIPGGDVDEMLCARAWRLRKETGWRELCWFIDNASPLMYWKGSYATHCEACYWEEKFRLDRRVKLYD